MKVTSLTIPNDLYISLDNFPCDKQAEIFINFFASISPNVTSLCLRKIHTFPCASIVSHALASTPSNVNLIDLSDIHHDNFMPIGVYKQWFPFLPLSVVFLNLSHIELGKQPDRTLLPELIATIPPSIKSLNLSGTGLGYYTVDQLKGCFELLPSNLNSLKLGQNGFHTKSSSELASILSAIPATVSFLDLSGESLGERLFSELVQILGAIPKNIHSLDLSWNQLECLPTEDLKRILADLPPHIMSINLSFNQINFDKTMSIFATLSPSIKMLKFECAKTGTSVEQFRKFMSILSPNIKSFDWSCFHCASEAHILHLLQILPYLPKNVNFLKLSKHRLGRPLVGKLFSTLPEWIKSLDLSDNYLHRYSIQNLQELAGSLPYITTVTLSYDEIFQMTSEQRVLFKNIFNTIERIIFVDAMGETINTSPSSKITQFLLELGVNKPPSLLNLCSFYAVKIQLNLSNLPLEVQEEVQYPIGNFFEDYAYR